MSRHLRLTFWWPQSLTDENQSDSYLLPCRASPPLPAATVDKCSGGDITGFLFYLHYLCSSVQTTGWAASPSSVYLVSSERIQIRDIPTGCWWTVHSFKHSDLWHYNDLCGGIHPLAVVSNLCTFSTYRAIVHLSTALPVSPLSLSLPLCFP